MKFEIYKEQVKRTLPHLGDWFGNKVILDSLHCVIGIFGEHYELDAALLVNDLPNIGEEITDKAWYATNYCNVRGIIPTVSLLTLSDGTIESLSDSARAHRIESASNSLNLALSELTDYDKKEWAYKKVWGEDVQQRRVELINTILNCINRLYALNGLDAEKCMEQNINKLRQRFPDKFDEDKANNRDTDAERIHLEN